MSTRAPKYSSCPPWCQTIKSLGHLMTRIFACHHYKWGWSVRPLASPMFLSELDVMSSRGCRKHITLLQLSGGMRDTLSPMLGKIGRNYVVKTPKGCDDQTAFLSSKNTQEQRCAISSQLQLKFGELQAAKLICDDLWPGQHGPTLSSFFLNGLDIQGLFFAADYIQ